MNFPQEIYKHIIFFPQFIKLDFFNDFIVKDVALGVTVVHVICEHKITGRVKIFAWGANVFGQLGVSDLEKVWSEPRDITGLFIEQKDIENDQKDIFFDEDEILQVVSGGHHTMVLTQST